MANIEPIHEFIFTDHALIEMARREITELEVKSVLANPEQMVLVREGRVVYQSKIEMGHPPKVFLVRVFGGIL